MRILSLLAIVIAAISAITAGLLYESPHGKDFKVSCSQCHSSKDWTLDREIYSFDHSTTKMPLLGQHVDTDCKMCHPTLVFSEAKTECIDCHQDIHEGTVGADCKNCHTPNFWLVENTTKIHQQSRFPLVGAHKAVDCFECHKTETFLRFEVLGTECVNCHNDNFLATTQPNHVTAGYSTQCEECHTIFSNEWKGSGFSHNFFPLTQGHDINDCLKCHEMGNYANVNKECVSCHQTDFNNTTNPNHQTLNFSTNCSECHSLSLDWKPAHYKQHDALSFPIYTGKHNGEWDECTECHTDASNYKVFTCIDCHEHNKKDMDNEHDEESKYQYNSAACFKCHPKGYAD